MIGQGNGINTKSAEFVLNNSDTTGPARQTDNQNQIPPINGQHSSAELVSLNRRNPEPCTPSLPLQVGEKDWKNQEKALSDSFRQLCVGSNLPGKRIMACDAKLQSFLQDNLATINEINKNIQGAAEREGHFDKKCMENLDQTGILLPVSKTGKSRLTPGKMGFDMKLPDALLQEPFYQMLLQAQGNGLEIGSGYGELCLRVLANKNVGHLDCVEPQITQLLSIQARVKSSQPDNLKRLALINCPFPEGFAAEGPPEYDFIICHRVFSVTPADIACQIIEGAFRLLKPGGRLFLFSLSDQHPGFQKNIGNNPESPLANNNGLIEVAAKKVLSGQDYNLPENITFIAQSPFEEYLGKTGFITEEISFPSTTSIAGTVSEEKPKRNIAFVLKKAESKH